MLRSGYCISLIASFLLSSAVPLHAQGPVNDHCGDVTPVALAVDSAIVFTGTTVGATNDGDNAPGSGLEPYGNMPVVWVAFTTTECADVAISFCGSANPFLSQYFWEVLTPQCPADQLIITTDYNNSECADGQPVIHHHELPAGTYYYPVWADQDGPVGDYVITISATACAPTGPVNDPCSGAASNALAVGDTLAITGDNTGATDSEGLGFANVWESFTLAECANVTIDYCGTTGFTDFAYGIFAECPATTLIDTTAADTCTGGNLIEHFEGLAAGTYWIPVLMAADNAEGAYAISVMATACDSVAVPANDLCANAVEVEVALPDSCATGSLAGDNTGATGTGDEPSCGMSETPWQDVWYSFHTGVNTQVAITLSAGTIANAGVEVFSACGDTAIACSSDGSVIDLAVLPDSVYLVRVFTQENGMPGTFELCITGDHTSGIRGIEQGTLHIFPNPGTGDITFVPAYSASEAVITILDMTGRPVQVERTGLIAGEAHRIGLNGQLKPGNYLLHVATPQGTSTGRVLVK